jgi:limonene-1,2-epoxide hydrolase
MGPEDTIRRFCEAISARDGDAAAALVDPSIVIVIGSNEIHGVEALRAMTGHRPEGLDSSLDVLAIEGADGKYVVTARRVQHWSESGELAVDQQLSIDIELNDQGLVARAEMRPTTD